MVAVAAKGVELKATKEAQQAGPRGDQAGPRGDPRTVKEAQQAGPRGDQAGPRGDPRTVKEAQQWHDATVKVQCSMVQCRGARRDVVKQQALALRRKRIAEAVPLDLGGVVDVSVLASLRGSG